MAAYRVQLPIGFRRLEYPLHQRFPADLRVFINVGPQVLQQAVGPPPGLGNGVQIQYVRHFPRPDFRHQTGQSRLAVPILAVIRHKDVIVWAGPVKFHDSLPDRPRQLEGSQGQRLPVLQLGGVGGLQNVQHRRVVFPIAVAGLNDQPPVVQKGYEIQVVRLYPGIQQIGQLLGLHSFFPPDAQGIAHPVIKQGVCVPGVEGDSVRRPGGQLECRPQALRLLVNDMQGPGVFPRRAHDGADRPHPPVAQRDQASIGPASLSLDRKPGLPRLIQQGHALLRAGENVPLAVRRQGGYIPHPQFFLQPGIFKTGQFLPVRIQIAQDVNLLLLKAPAVLAG